MQSTRIHRSARRHPPATARARAICARRDAHGMTNKQLAAALGVDSTTVWRIIVGRSVPGQKVAAAYSQTFGVDALADLYPSEVAA